VFIVGASLSLSTAIASEFENKGINVTFVEPVNPMQLNAQPESVATVHKALEAFSSNLIINEILTLDYGAENPRQVNSNKLTYRESNVFTANFAKVQNQNFERILSAS